MKFQLRKPTFKNLYQKHIYDKFGYILVRDVKNKFIIEMKKLKI
jgi:hypothetical protein